MNSLSRPSIMLISLAFAGLFAFGREGKKIYTVADNGAWSNLSTWSFNPGGATAGVLPQSTDTIIINKAVILNADLNLSGNGQLLVVQGGLLKGEAARIFLHGSSIMQVDAIARVNNLEADQDSRLIISNQGVLTVLQQIKNYSVVPALVNGELSIAGALECGGNSSFTGIGTLKGNQYLGQGLIMNIQASDVPVKSVLSEVNWIGNVSNDWNDPMNWSNSEALLSTMNIGILPSNHNPVITQSVHCNQLSLSPGVMLTLKPGSSLLVDGKVSIPLDASLIMKNSLSQKSAFVARGEVLGKISSEYPVVPNMPMYVSSPVADAQSGVFVNMYLREFNEPSSNWGSYIVPTDVVLNAMQGYELVSLYPSTRTFEGVPNTGGFSQVVTAEADGWNLIGNPYPSYIDWQGNSNLGWQVDPVAGAIYYPDPSGSGNFSVYLPGTEDMSINGGSRYIAPMQGFFVKARKSGVIKVNEDAVVAGLPSEVSSLPVSSLKFRLSDESFADETVVRFNTSSSFGFDDDYDAYKITGTGSAPSIFTENADGDQVAVNTMPSLSSSLQIPLHVTCASETQLRLSIEGGSQFEYRYPLTLEDKETHTFVDLRKDSSYVFNHAPSFDPNRFVLHFDMISGVDDQARNTEMFSFTDHTIRIKGLENQSATIEVFGLDGKQVLKTTAALTSGFTLPFEGFHGIYIIQVTTNTARYAHKFYAE